MTQPNEPGDPTDPTEPIAQPVDQPGPPPPPPYQPPYQPPPYEQPAYGPPTYAQPGYGYPPGYHPAAPYGVHPMTGVPYSEKSKLVAALLQILIPLGIGRMYIGDTRTGVIQLIVTVVTCGIGALWPFIDGIMMLVGDPVDSEGRPLRG
jgi:TM2 domain-containing membrane protein YozV